MHRIRYSVVPCPKRLLKRGWRRGWQVLRDHRLFAVYRTQHEAVRRARGWAKNRWKHGQVAQVQVHSRSGRIRFELTFGNDPFPPRG